MYFFYFIIMKTKIITFFGVAIVGIGLVGCDCGCSKHNESDTTSMMTQEAIQDEEQSSYMSFTQERFDTLRGEKKFVVFFHADWCGTCRKWDEHMREIAADLPADAMVLKADYDTNKDLVKALHVKSQSSAVFFNADGEILDTLMDPSMEEVQKFFTQEKGDMFSDEKFQAYTSESRAALSGQKNILFFYADWCGTCRKWQKNILTNIDTLPEGTRILRANYDTDLELKKEFGIKMQSVAAFINEDGSLFKTHADPSLEMVKEFFAQ